MRGHILYVAPKARGQFNRWHPAIEGWPTVAIRAASRRCNNIAGKVAISILVAMLQ